MKLKPYWQIVGMDSTNAIILQVAKYTWQDMLSFPMENWRKSKDSKLLQQSIVLFTANWWKLQLASTSLLISKTWSCNRNWLPRECVCLCFYVYINYCSAMLLLQVWFYMRTEQGITAKSIKVCMTSYDGVWNNYFLKVCSLYFSENVRNPSQI